MAKTPHDRWLLRARCGAKNRRGLPCQSLAMKNGRCRLHGGKSTGAKTEGGIARIIQANITTGQHTKERRENRKALRKALKELEAMYL